VRLVRLVRLGWIKDRAVGSTMTSEVRRCFDGDLLPGYSADSILDIELLVVTDPWRAICHCGLYSLGS